MRGDSCGISIYFCPLFDSRHCVIGFEWCHHEPHGGALGRVQLRGLLRAGLAERGDVTYVCFFSISAVLHKIKQHPSTSKRNCNESLLHPQSQSLYINETHPSRWPLMMYTPEVDMCRDDG